MRKRIFCGLLCAAMILAFVFPAGAKEQEPAAETRTLTIHTLRGFLLFAENCRLDSYSRGLRVILKTDLDLEGQEFEGIPIFEGSFDGQGHTIRGLRFTGDGAVRGLFRYLTASAQVRQLHVEGWLHPGGSQSQVGGIAGCNSGSIEQCSFQGSISGGSYVGGIAGKNTVTGSIDDCSTEGTLQGKHFVGGVAGENLGVIRNCKNRAQVNTSAQENSVDLSDVTLDSLKNSESSDTVTDIGGIAGSSTGVIRSCVNLADVGYRQMGYNIGGIAGTQSGYLTDCENRGCVSGRKEIGGIVGQMEPTSTMIFVEDTLQILQGQLDAMSGIVNRASGDAQDGAGKIYGKLQTLVGQTADASEALGTLLPTEENPGPPDADTILAARNALNHSLNAMTGTINGIAGTTQETAAAISKDMQAIQRQMNAMGKTIRDASESMGGEIVDVSDRDMPDELAGQLDESKNSGAVLGDLNVGGIVGAISMENDMDFLEDWQTLGEESMNFRSEVRAVVIHCSNSGSVTVKKQCGGGIAGWQSMGLVKSCVNTGSLIGEGAGYVGGITGRALSYIRSCASKCVLEGDEYVGGIAGSGAVVTDCYSMAQFPEKGEWIGQILGSRESTDQENPIQDNFYLVTSRDRGGIDGVSYDTMAQPMAEKAFFSSDALPVEFASATITFVQEDGTKSVRHIRAGGTLTPRHIPKLHRKEGYTAFWPGVDASGLEKVYFDRTIVAEYAADLTVMASQELSQGKPLLLLEGAFTHDGELKTRSLTQGPTLPEEAEALGGLTFSTSTDSSISAGRYLIPVSCRPESLKVSVLGENGQWRDAKFTVDGSYLVIPLEETDTGIFLCAVPQTGNPWLWIGPGVIVVALIAVGAVLLRRRKPTTPPQEDTSEYSF